MICRIREMWSFSMGLCGWQKLIRCAVDLTHPRSRSAQVVKADAAASRSPCQLRPMKRQADCRPIRPLAACALSVSSYSHCRHSKCTAKKLWTDESGRPLTEKRYSPFRPIGAGQLSPYRPISQIQFLRNGILRMSGPGVAPPIYAGKSLRVRVGLSQLQDR